MDLPTPEAIAAMFREAWREQAFWQENYQRLALEYPDKHLAVRDRDVIAVGADPFDLADKIRALGFEPHEVWTRYISAQPMRILL